MNIEIGKIVKIGLNSHHKARVLEWNEALASGLIEVMNGPDKGLKMSIAQWMHGYVAIDATGRVYRVAF